MAELQGIEYASTGMAADRSSKMGLILWTVMILIIFSSVVKAQDIATEHTQLLNNIELITENLRQLQSLENQIEMIKNQVEELKSVATYQNNFSDIDALRNNLTNITSQGTSLSNQTQGILSQMQQEINNLPANGTMTDRENSIDQSTMNILQKSLNRVTQERQNYQQETDAVNALLAKSEQAVGQTQALQTSNELAAQSIQQMQSTRELLSENIIVQATATMREIQEKQDMVNTMNQILQPGDSNVNMEN
jgi:P-type conjugative transfer protein TrbJ